MEVFRQAGTLAIAGSALCTLAMAQSVSLEVVPLRHAPTESLAVNAGFRDWAPTTLAGTTIMGGNAGLFAVDTRSGKLKWTARPGKTARSNPFVSTAPAVLGDKVFVPLGGTLLALSLSSGKELWRGPATAQGASVAAGAGLAFVMGDEGVFYALDAATGREQWRREFSRAGACDSVPVLRDGTLYLSGNVLLRPADASRSAEYFRHLFALDAATGQERWRYPATSQSGRGGICFTQPIVTADTFYALASATLYAVNLANGQERWRPVEVRVPVDGQVRAAPVHGLVDAGQVLVGLTSGFLLAFDKGSGQTAWQLSGQYSESHPSTAVAGRVLYFQGHPGAVAAPQVQGWITYSGGRPVETAPVLPLGRLNALDLDSRAILWSFSRPTREPNWPFGHVTPFDGGLWVDSYQALVKLQ